MKKIYRNFKIVKKLAVINKLKFAITLDRKRSCGRLILKYLLTKKPVETGLDKKFYFSFFAYFLLNFSTLPAVSTNFCFPVKNGWDALEISNLTRG